MALGFFLLILVIVACAFNEGRTQTVRELPRQDVGEGGCGPLASHSAPPRADYAHAARFVCGDCGQLRTYQGCESCDAISRGVASMLAGA